MLLDDLLRLLLNNYQSIDLGKDQSRDLLVSQDCLGRRFVGYGVIVFGCHGGCQWVSMRLSISSNDLKLSIKDERESKP